MYKTLKVEVVQTRWLCSEKKSFVQNKARKTLMEYFSDGVSSLLAHAQPFHSVLLKSDEQDSA